MACQTVWSFDIVDIDGEYLDSCDICIEFPSESMANMVVCNGIQVYPKELRGIMFYLAKEEFGGYPKFRLEFQRYVGDEYSECGSETLHVSRRGDIECKRSENGSETCSQDINKPKEIMETDYVADFTLCTDLASVASNISEEYEIEWSDVDTDETDDDDNYDSELEEWTEC